MAGGMKEIPDLDQWRSLAGELAEAGYRLSQFQYAANEPTGFLAWFWSAGRPQIEIMTRSRAVELAIVAYNEEQRRK
jgi:hypothetical protein